MYERRMERWQIRKRFPQPDWSIVDLWVARKLLQQGTPPAHVEAILRMGSPHFPRRHHDSVLSASRWLCDLLPVIPTLML